MISCIDCRALELDPQNQAVLSNRAFAYIRAEEYGSAIADASAAIAMDPKLPKVGNDAVYHVTTAG